MVERTGKNIPLSNSAHNGKQDRPFPASLQVWGRLLARNDSDLPEDFSRQGQRHGQQNENDRDRNAASMRQQHDNDAHCWYKRECQRRDNIIKIDRHCRHSYYQSRKGKDSR